MLKENLQKKILRTANVFAWVQMFYIIYPFSLLVYFERWHAEIFHVNFNLPEFNGFAYEYSLLSLLINILDTFDFIIVGGAFISCGLLVFLSAQKKIDIAKSQLIFSIVALVISSIIFFHSL